jgi:hypothetical protein
MLLLRCSLTGGFDVDIDQFLTIHDSDAQFFRAASR